MGIPHARRAQEKTPQYVVKKKLETLPKRLDNTYARVLAQIPGGRRKDAQFVLLCMVAAPRPLGKKKEIATAFGTWTDDSILPRQDLDKYADICSACNSIIYLDNADGEYTTVNFLHQSVKYFCCAIALERMNSGIIPLQTARISLCSKCAGIFKHGRV
jgi:hypothetical protein